MPGAKSAAQLIPVGGEFQVSVYTVSSQRSADVAGDLAGNFVAVWHSYGQDGETTGIFARRFDSSGMPVGTEFQVNSYTVGYQYGPTVAARPDGGFVVVWDSSSNFGLPNNQDGSYSGVFGQRFASTGARQGSEFQVSSQTLGYQENPEIAIGAAGGFLVAWGEYDGSYAGVFARRFASDGTPQGNEFQVNTHTPNGQNLSAVAAAGGGFVVVWGTFAEDGASGGVLARRYDSSGAPQGAAFQVNAYTQSFEGSGAIAAGADGGFTIAWHVVGGLDGSGFGVFGRRFDGAGTALGAEFQLNSYTIGLQASPNLAALPSGDFMVAWDSTGQNPGNQDIFASAFRSSGIAFGNEVQVNQYPSDLQSHAELAALGQNGFVAVWDSQNQDGQFVGVFGRRFAIAGSPVRGKKLLIRTPPTGTSRNKLAYLSTDNELETPENIGEDPRCPPAGSGSITAGATLRVVGAGGDFTIDLPCLNWSANSSGSRYQYRDGSGATCRSIVIRDGRFVKALCKGPQVAYALGAAQGNVHVVLSTGDPTTHGKYCSSFGPQFAASIIHDGSNGLTYKALDAAPGSCP